MSPVDLERIKHRRENRPRQTFGFERTLVEPVSAYDDIDTLVAEVEALRAKLRDAAKDHYELQAELQRLQVDFEAARAAMRDGEEFLTEHIDLWIDEESPEYPKAKKLLARLRAVFGER